MSAKQLHQLALPGLLPTRIVEGFYEVDDEGRVCRTWRENICTVEEYSGWRPRQ